MTFLKHGFIILGGIYVLSLKTRKVSKMNVSAAILSAILNGSKCPIVPTWHHSDFDLGHDKEQ